MRFTYLYKDDPDMDELVGNITWIVPNSDSPAHWLHAEYICKLMVRTIFLHYEIQFYFRSTGPNAVHHENRRNLLKIRNIVVTSLNNEKFLHSEDSSISIMKTIFQTSKML